MLLMQYFVQSAFHASQVLIDHFNCYGYLIHIIIYELQCISMITTVLIKRRLEKITYLNIIIIMFSIIEVSGQVSCSIYNDCIYTTCAIAVGEMGGCLVNAMEGRYKISISNTQYINLYNENIGFTYGTCVKWTSATGWSYCPEGTDFSCKYASQACGSKEGPNWCSTYLIKTCGWSRANEAYSYCQPGPNQQSSTSFDQCCNCTEKYPNSYCPGNGSRYICNKCSDGFYAATPCTSCQNTICKECNISCKVGFYESTSCTKKTNRVCTKCFTCNQGTYQSSSCTNISDTICINCLTCDSDSYEISPCTNTTDRTCTKCLICESGSYEISPCTNATNRICTNCSTCKLGTYESEQCTNTTNRICANCSNCNPETYQKFACTNITNTVCTACLRCNTTSFETAPCTNTTNRICSTCNTCNATSYETTSCTNTTNRVCTNC